MSDLLISNNHVLCRILGEVKTWYVPYYYVSRQLLSPIVFVHRAHMIEMTGESMRKTKKT